MYNKAAFNRTQFNRWSGGAASMSVAIVNEYCVVVSPLRVLAKQPETTLSARYNLQVGELGLYVPLPAVDINSEYGVTGAFSALVPIFGVTIEAEYGVTVGAIRTAETDEINLEGLGLAPGQTLIIDTDTLEIEVDGEVRVDSWVTGGSFFQLKAGDNILQFTDNAGTRDLIVTLLWADRYL